MLLLSVIVTITDGENHLDRCLEALAGQVGAPPVEILVPVYAGIEDVPSLRRRWPQVKFVEVEGHPPLARSLAHWLYDRRRAAGLSAASGDLIAITEDHAIPGPEWCAAIARLHEAPYAVIGGAIEHGGRGLLNWAAYFCDFGRYHKPFPAHAAGYVSDINVSYKREALLACASVWRDYYHETAVHHALRAAGHTLWLTPELSLLHDRGRLPLGPLLAERFYWARVFAGRRARAMTPAQRALYALLSPALPLLLLARKFREASRGGSYTLPYLRALPAMLLLLSVWSCGELTGYWTGRSFPSDPEGGA